MDALIPSRASIVTTAATDKVPATIYVTAADGIYALDPASGGQRWFYEMDMPPGDAPLGGGQHGFCGRYGLHNPRCQRAPRTLDVADGARGRPHSP